MGALGVKRVLAKHGMLRKDRGVRPCLNGRLDGITDPGPRISKPQLRKDMDRRVFRSAIADSNLEQNIFGCSLAILDEHIKVAVFVEGVCIDQLELGILFAPAPVFFDEPIVGEFPLRIFVKHLEIRMRRRCVEVVIKLLNVFAVISLTVRESEKPLFQNRILPIPEGQSQTEALMVVAQTGNAVFAPTIGTAARLVVT